jgi:hypothetical protein
MLDRQSVRLALIGHRRLSFFFFFIIYSIIFSLNSPSFSSALLFPKSKTVQLDTAVWRLVASCTKPAARSLKKEKKSVDENEAKPRDVGHVSPGN